MPEKVETYVGGGKWEFSDAIYQRLTCNTVRSNFNPSIRAFIADMGTLIPDKQTFCIYWDAPTFKDIDCNYLLHVVDQCNPNLILSTSSGNTVEGLARIIQRYNDDTGNSVEAILLVPEISAYKVSARTIHDNPHVKYLVLRNATLDSTRAYATKLFAALSETRHVVVASEDLKAAAYAQMGLMLDGVNLFDDEMCYVQTVSGGVGPAGIMEAAHEMGRDPELLVIQPINGTPGPIVDALVEHTAGRDPLLLLHEGHYETSQIEPTLASTMPIYTVNKLVSWREAGGRVGGTSVPWNYLRQQKDRILKALVRIGVYSDARIGQYFFDIEKSGFLAIAGAMLAAQSIQSQKIIINFTGRRPESVSPGISDFEVATPHFFFDPTLVPIDEIVEKLSK